MTTFKKRWPQDLSVQPDGVDSDARVVLISAGDVALAAAVARDAACAGVNVMLLHREADTAMAVQWALGIEAAGRRCELIAGDLDDAQVCEEAAIHAAYLGRGSIGALACATALPHVLSHGAEGAAAALQDAEPDEALHQAEANVLSLIQAALPYLSAERRMTWLLPALGAGGGVAALAAHSALRRRAQELTTRLRHEHGLRAECVVAGQGGLDGAGPRRPEFRPSPPLPHLPAPKLPKPDKVGRPA